MARLEFFIPGDPNTKTGGYLYDKRISMQLRALGWQVVIHQLADSFPNPTLQDLEHAEHCFAMIPNNAMVLVDGLAFGVLDAVALSHRRRLRLVALVHHPLCQETGISTYQARILRRSESRALQCARRVIVTSNTTGAGLGELQVDKNKIAVVRPGTDAATMTEVISDETLHLICVGSVTARKGHSDLLDALVKLTDLPWQLHCVGSLQRDHYTASNVIDKISHYLLNDRVHLYGEVTHEKLQSLYARSHLMVLASHHEGYGMVLSEALIRGIPVISTNAGAIPEVVGTNAGVLVDKGDTDALSSAIRRFIEDPVFRQRLHNGAREQALTFPSWRESGQLFAEQLASVT